MEGEPYSLQDFFAGEAAPEKSPRALIGPHRYIQGDGVIDNLGRYLSVFNSSNPAILITKTGFERIGARVLISLSDTGKKPVVLYFEGECCDAEIDRLVKQLTDKPVDILIAIGGGRCLDAGKCVARFFAKVGLPIHLDQLSIDPEQNQKEIDFIVEQAMNVPLFENEPFAVTPQKLKQAIFDAHKIGLAVSKKIGDQAYRRLHQ